ncbi:MAG: stage III sporulation protein AB [Clostridia bacterium]|nr:stage III sporulation protein AB [Clostridia bacterium]
MWLKFLVCICIVAFCIFLGYLAAAKYRSRKMFFSQLAVFNERYLTELCYARKPLSEFLREYEYSGDFAKTVSAFAQHRVTESKLSYLTKDEKKLCADYFGMLGKGDAVSQKSYFSSQKGELNEKKTSSEREAKSRGELYLKLGLLAGLAFVILIV